MIKWPFNSSVVNTEETLSIKTLQSIECQKVWDGTTGESNDVQGQSAGSDNQLGKCMNNYLSSAQIFLTISPQQYEY